MNDLKLPTRLVCVVDDEAEIDEIRAEGGDLVKSVTNSTWSWYPERRQIIIGSRDEIFSRALGEGFGVKRQFRNIEFGLLNNDSVWLVGSSCKLWNRLAATHRAYGTYNVVHASRPDNGRVIPIDRIYRGLDTLEDAGIRSLLGEPGRTPTFRFPRNRSHPGWLPLKEHLDMAVAAASYITTTAAPPHSCAVITAARYHDLAKSHGAFQRAIKECHDSVPSDAEIWAKSPYSREFNTNGFYHDLIGGCAMYRMTGLELESYLVLTHHGHHYARAESVSGTLESTDIGGGIVTPAVDYTMTTEQWAKIAENLVGKHGPFTLSYLEALLRSSDLRSFSLWNDRRMRAPQIRQQRLRHRTSSRSAPWS